MTIIVAHCVVASQVAKSVTCFVNVAARVASVDNEVCVNPLPQQIKIGAGDIEPCWDLTVGDQVKVTQPGGKLFYGS